MVAGNSSASQILYAHIGAPSVKDCLRAPQASLCWVCAGPAPVAMPRKDWNGASFTGQSRVRAPSSQWVCTACVWFASRISPVPGRPPAEGKKFGGNFRNYSHLFCADAATPYLNASKGEKPLILRFLRGPKKGLWFAAVADSGQKHVLPWTPVNYGPAGGVVLFDETLVSLPDYNGWAIVDDMRQLLTAGSTKDEILTGRYEASSWSRCRELVEHFEAAWSTKRFGSWFTLAIWLAQRDEELVATRQEAERQTAVEKKKAAAGKSKKPAAIDVDKPKEKRGRKAKGEVAEPDRGISPRGSRGLPPSGGKPVEALGSDAEPNAERRATNVEPGRVGNPAPAGAPAAGPKQLGLPGFA